MRWATASAWAWPGSARWSPGARPGSTWPVVEVWPWRTNSDERARRGLGGLGGAACHGRMANLPSGRGFARISHRRDHCLPGLPAAGGVAGAGGGGQASLLCRRGLLGPARARLRRPGCQGARGRPRAGGARREPDRAACSRATDRVTGCSVPCTAPAWPTSRRAPTETTASRSPGRTSRLPCDARRRPTSRRIEERDRCLPVPGARAGVARRRAGRGVSRRVRLRRRRAPSSACGRSRGSAMASRRRRRAAARCCAPSTPASRTPSPAD